MAEEALPCVGRYHLPVNRPLFDVNLTPNDPVFTHSPHSKFQTKISNFSRASSAFQKFINFQLKMANFHSNLTQFTPNDPYFGKFKSKRSRPRVLGIPHPKTPFFLRNPTPKI